jgi:hypothetical protein
LKEGLTARTADEAISGTLDKKSEIYLIDQSTSYRVGLQRKRAKVVVGHEVLTPAFRNHMIVNEEIKWDKDINSEAVGKVTREVVDEGDVSGRVLAAWQAEQDRLTAEKAEQDRLVAELAGAEEENDGVSTFKHGGDEGDGIRSDDNGEGLSKPKAHRGGDDDIFGDPYSNASKVSTKGTDSGMKKAEPKEKKTPPKKDDGMGTRGRAQK